MCSKFIIWAILETGLGINATAACVLRPLFTRFHMLSGSGVNQAEPTTNYHQGMRRSQGRIPANKSRIHDNDIKSYGVASTIDFLQGGS
jgi:hypothetical protein